MWLLAAKNIWQERTKFLITVGGVTFSVLLMVMLSGLYQGWKTMMGAYVASIPADLWIEQEGMGDMYHTLSFLPANLEDRIEAVAGVKTAYPFLSRAVQFQRNDDDVTLLIVGFDPTTGIGQPSTMTIGRWQDLQPGEIIIDDAFARKQEVVIGEKLIIGDRDLTVAGISSGGNLITSQYAFVLLSDAKQLFQLGETTNFYIVQLEPGASATDVRARILTTLPGTAVKTQVEFVASARSVIEETFLPIIFVLDLIALGVGIAVIGLTTYSATIEKAREYGVMKAIGLTNGLIMRLVFYQALLAGVLGYLLGVGLAYPLGYAGEQYAAAFLVALRPIDLGLVAGLTAIMVLLAAYVPTRRITRIDPAIVFKS